MTDEELLDSIASNPIVNQRKEEIRVLVDRLKSTGLKTIHRKVRGYWTKTNSNFTLSSTEHTVDLIDSFSDIYQVKFFWTTDGLIKIVNERWFRKHYPDPELTGTPEMAAWLHENTFRFHPIADEDKTIYLSYYYLPSYTSIDELPERFHDVIEYFILSHFEVEPGKYTMLFQQAIGEMASDVSPAEELEPDLIFGETQEDIRDVQSSLKGHKGASFEKDYFIVFVDDRSPLCSICADL